MTEDVWLACQTPQEMLESLQSGQSERKMRLFACACCHSVPAPRQEPPSRGERTEHVAGAASTFPPESRLSPHDEGRIDDEFAFRTLRRARRHSALLAVGAHVRVQ